jgi:hypothetical protein
VSVLSVVFACEKMIVHSCRWSSNRKSQEIMIGGWTRWLDRSDVHDWVFNELTYEYLIILSWRLRDRQGLKHWQITACLSFVYSLNPESFTLHRLFVYLLSDFVRLHRSALDTLKKLTSYNVFSSTNLSHRSAMDGSSIIKQD